MEIRPALSIEAFFETTFNLARAGKANDLGLPTPLRLAVIADRFEEELRFAGVPKRVQVY